MAATSSGDTARRVVVVGYEGSELLDIACVTSLETLRQAFVAQYGVPPSQYRTVSSTTVGAGSDR